MPKKPLAYRGDEPFVFVSYAHADAELAYPLISGLQERGLRIWFDDGMDVGDIWENVIPDHVEQCTAMLCLVSSHFTDSNNCLDEIHYAKEQKKELLILHLENEDLPRNFRFRYGRFHALRLSDYSNRDALLDKLADTPKLRCCLCQEESEEIPEEIYQKGKACYEAKSYKEAVEWYRKAVKMGHPEAMCSLGFCHSRGYGITKSQEEAIKWYRRAANLGNVTAMYNLGCYYDDGTGASQPYAVKWYRRAADKGDTDAMVNLGYCYAKGNGVSQSYEEAIQWYRRAAGKGHAGAMRWLSNCYANGRGVAKDPKQAEYWKNKADQAEADASN